MLKKFITIILFFLTGSYANAQVTFVVESLPAATPVADSIFVCGNFNDWVTADPKLALQRQLNGRLAITVDLPPGRYEYKFTRGSWTKVETDRDNHYTKNRVIQVKDRAATVTAQIVNWLDLGGARPLNYMSFYFFACAFQGIALCFFVYRIQKKDGVKFQSFLIVNAVFVLLLFLMVYLEVADQIWQTYFGFFFQICFFCWGPLLLYFFHAMIGGRKVPSFYWYGIPALIALLFVLVRLFNVQTFSFLSDVIWPPLTWATGLVTAFGFIFNLFVYYRIYHGFAFLKINHIAEGDVKSNLLHYIFWVSLLALGLIPVNILLLVNGMHHPSIEYFHGVAIVMTAIIFIETYFIWRHPEIMREEKVTAPVGDYSPELLARLQEYMLVEKPFRKADLTVSDLAEMLGVRPNVLSRIINEHYDRNFRDFLNAYRIEEFIALANTKAFKHYTFLALAQEVGFNSKSTFNLAFKKFTNQSPREYFKSRE
jgi:AraC-like DNA-binding protein